MNKIVIVWLVAITLTALTGCGSSDKVTAATTVTQTVHRTHAQVVAARARARATAKAAARAHARAVAELKTQERAQAKAFAATNAWHRGYVQQDDNVYWKWKDIHSCQDYATNGCWHVVVITDNGCQSYVAVNANEYSGSAIVGSLLANQSTGIPPRTARIFELDADAQSVTANDVKVDCS